MKTLYAFWVLVISFEFVLLLFLFAFFFNGFEIQFFENLKITRVDDVLKWILVLPFGVLAWNLNEARITLSFNGSQVKTILNWKNYWKFKIHIFVSVFYTCMFALISIIPWFYFGAEQDPRSIYFFTAGFFGQMIVASSLYFAKLKVFEILNRHGA